MLLIGFHQNHGREQRDESILNCLWIDHLWLKKKVVRVPKLRKLTHLKKFRWFSVHSENCSRQKVLMDVESRELCDIKFYPNTQVWNIKFYFFHFPNSESRTTIVPIKTTGCITMVTQGCCHVHMISLTSNRNPVKWSFKGKFCNILTITAYISMSWLWPG